MSDFANIALLVVLFVVIALVLRLIEPKQHPNYLHRLRDRLNRPAWRGNEEGWQSMSQQQQILADIKSIRARTTANRKRKG